MRDLGILRTSIGATTALATAAAAGIIIPVAVNLGIHIVRDEVRWHFTGIRYNRD